MLTLFRERRGGRVEGGKKEGARRKGVKGECKSNLDRQEITDGGGRGVGGGGRMERRKK